MNDADARWLLPQEKSPVIPPPVAMSWMERLLGPVHRLCWSGPDRQGDRKRCLKHLQPVVRSAYNQTGPVRTAAVLVDWWLQAATGESPVGIAWLLGDNLKEGPVELIQALDRVIEHQSDSPALQQLRKPARFAQAREHLRELVERPVKFKKNPAPEIYGGAREQAWQLVHRAESPEDGPLDDLELLSADTEDWASETRSAREALHRRVKVWNHLVKKLDELQAAARELVSNWTIEQPAQPPLPADWRKWLGNDLSPCAAIAEAILWDVASVDPTFHDLRPYCLRAEWLLDTLQAIPGELPRDARVPLLALAREAIEDAPSHPAPAWVEDAENELITVRTRIRTLKAQADSMAIEEAQQLLEEALSTLDRLDISESADWIRIAEETIEQKTQDETAARLERELAAWQAELVEVGGEFAEIPGPAAEESLEDRHETIHDRWKEAKRNLEERLEAIGSGIQYLGPGPTKEQSGQKLEAAGQAIEQGQLGSASRLLDTVEDLVLAERRAMDERLRPELRDIKERASKAEFRERELESLRSVLLRIEERAEAGLEHRWMIEALEALVTAAERHEAESLAILGVLIQAGDVNATRRVRVTHWLASGVEIDPLRFGGADLELPPKLGRAWNPGDLIVVGGHAGWFRRDAGVSRIQREPEHVPDGSWHDIVPTSTLEEPPIEEIRDYPFRDDLAKTYFIAARGKIQGPYRKDEERLSPADRRGFVARMDADQFSEQFGLIEIGALPLRQAASRRLVHTAPDLEDLLSEDAEPVDRLDSAAIEVWLADLVRELAGTDVTLVARAVARLETLGDQLPQAILEHRIKLLNEFLETSRLFQDERRRAAESFVETPEGQREVQRAASRRVEEMTETVQRQVDERRQSLETNLAQLEETIEDRRRQLSTLENAEIEQREELSRQTEDIRKEIDALRELRDDAKTRLLAEILSGSEPRAAAPSRSTPVEAAETVEPLSAVRRPVRPVGRLVELTADLTRRLAAWSDHEVANLLSSLVASPWVLMAGPPGVGKSTFARALLSQLGHGPETERCLEMVVRRDWNDDSPLFGFWHPQQRAWLPSSEGFVELLLTALDDEQRGYGGLYTALLEEMNLASPEYYLSRPISALEATAPQIRLYGSELHPVNEGRYPATFPFPANVRLVGTVNVDDTVERLSPRFLSRVTVIWMEPALESLANPLELPEPPDVPIDWREVCTGTSTTAPPTLDPILRLVSFLHEQRVSGAPTPRTIRGIQAYMRVAQELLPGKVAEDYQVLQRILPGIRGIGESYRRILDGLTDLCSRQTWRMSAQRCEQIRIRGEELGDFYDFFHC